MLSVAVVGLDRSGRAFVEGLCALADEGVRVRGVVVAGDDGLDPPAGVPVLALEEMVALGESLDIVFELSGDTELRRRLRQALFASGNQHTVIAPATVARLTWLLLGRRAFPAGEDGGY